MDDERNLTTIIAAAWLTLAACGSAGATPTALDADTPTAPEIADAPQEDTTTPDVPVVGDEGPTPPDGVLELHCFEHVGSPRVEEVAPGLWVALAYDLANTILIETADGNVVIDVSMSPERAQAVKNALQSVAPGPTLAIIYTHSHIDHVGGASVWIEDGTETWATEALFPHLIKQYGAFRKAESARAALQFGQGLSDEDFPCSAIGRRPDVVAALVSGVRKPTHTFTGSAALEFGGVPLELHEAHGETHDQLYVWLPALEALLPGDNYYAAFPNLYTIRGTSPRPVDAWIRSLDDMRRLQPALLVPSHTEPRFGVDAIAASLTDYRDAIQWLRDEVVRGANLGESADSLAQRVTLPPHLAEQPFLAELYGQVDWSVRAIYTNHLGWFDGRADRLYPPEDLARREVELMGGAQAVLQTAIAAREAGELRWSTHLLGKLRDSGLAAEAELHPELAASLRALGATVHNTNGRAFLLGTANILVDGPSDPGTVALDPELLEDLPVSVVFSVTETKLIAEQALEVHESLEILMQDTGERWILTVRRGVAEIVEGTPLPGTPAPVAVVTTDSLTWKQLSLKLLDPVDAVAQGLLEADDLLAVLSFLNRFDQSF